MNLLIFGATGSVGRHIVRQALEAGHRVTAFARDPTKVGILHERLTIVQGNVMEPALVDQAIPSHEAVLAALGSQPWNTHNVRSEGNRLIVRAMVRTGIRRLVSLSTLGAGDSWKSLPLKYRILFRTILRKAFADQEAQERHIMQSPLDWVIVRPGEFIEGDRTGMYRHGFAVTDNTITATISHADVADFMLKQVADDTYLRKTPGLSY